MDRFDRIYALHKILSNARRPVSGKALQQRLECSRASVNRIIEDMKDFLNAPIEYDRRANGYHYASTGAHSYELPGLWFNASELYALLATQQLLSAVQPGLLDQHLAPLRQRIEALLKTQAAGAGDITHRVRILAMAARPVGESFQTVAGAVMQHRRLHLQYHGRGRDDITERDVSPQRLIHYRDNWYLDGWCHLRNQLRSFSIDRISRLSVLDQPALEIADTALDEFFAGAYGIFSGQADQTAVLHFTPRAARWVADEQWHPRQLGRFLDNGHYELEIPYRDARELIMDILKYGPEVEVVGPEELRNELVQRLRQTVQVYGGK